MADIVRRDGAWDGFPTLTGMRQMMDRLFDDSFLRTAAGAQGWDDGMLPVDISSKDQELVVRASVPGFKKDDIDVQVHQGVLSINAKYTDETEDKGETFYRKERRYGSVSRRIALPGIVHDAPVDAELKDGVLTLKIQVPEQARPKQIEIKSVA
jgi:HSP20 family protein